MKLECCALCDKPFDGVTAFNSREHIILNSIGGKKKVPWVLCKECNDRTGNDWDSVLAEQLSFLSIFVNIKKDRGEQRAVDVVTMSGQQIRKHADGHLTFRPEPPVITKTESGASFSASVSTMEEARKLLEGLKRTYPKLDVESELKKLKLEETYLPDPVKSSVNIGGGTSGRSIVKSAFVLAVHSGVVPQHCEFARRYLTGDDEAFCWWFYYDREVITNRSPHQIFHCVAVMGNPRTKQLVGYVEFFGAFRMLVLLSTNYSGEEFSASYAIDPTTGEELVLSVKLDIPADEVRTACDGGYHYVAGFTAAMNWLIPLARDRSFARERERIIEEASLEALSRFGLAPGEPLGPEQTAERTRLILERLQPCLLHQAKALSTPIELPEEWKDS